MSLHRLLVLYSFFCIGFPQLVAQTAPNNYVQFVNPMIGTKRMGHTFPGATVPFGSVQLSPDTNYEPYSKGNGYNPDTYKYCAGYQYEDSTIFGFSHTHFSGTGHSDLGDILVMPGTGALMLEPGVDTIPGSGYHSGFSHKNEIAQPAYYKVHLDDCNVTAELTATERVGFHRYTFPASDSAYILLDLMYNIYDHEDKNTWVFVRVLNDSTLTGYRQTQGWGRTRLVHFAIRFSKSFESYGHKKYDPKIYNGFYRKFNEEENFPEMAGRDIRAYFKFKTADKEQIMMKVGLSSVSPLGALNNLDHEIPHWNFDKIVQEGQAKWNKELGKIEVETITPEDKVTFYTALYHSLLTPILYEDVDGRYRGLDQEIHQSKGFTNYSIFSLWDTYRALHPFFNFIQPSRNNDMIYSMLAHQKQSVHGMLPIWSHYANENWCMIGYHAVSVIADAIVKETTNVDKQRALEACIATSNVPYFDGLGEYIQKGYVPEDKSSNSVSKTLEYAYNDWCISQIASRTNDLEAFEQYQQRANNYKAVYDPKSAYMRPKLSDGTFREAFDPLDTHGQGFIEGNALNYGLYVPHNIPEMISMMGGKKKFAEHLDYIFNVALDDKYIEKNEDITRDGIIGAYVHGNEPGHHIPYLYNYTDQYWKTQERVRMINRTMYSHKEDGLCGNDDAGQMSAWYLFSALGFYPVLPGSEEYTVGSPSIKSATIHLENGKTLYIKTKNQSAENVYVQKLTWNGGEIKSYKLFHRFLMGGGELVFEMGKRKKE